MPSSAEFGRLKLEHAMLEARHRRVLETLAHVEAVHPQWNLLFDKLQARVDVLRERLPRPVRRSQ